MSLNAHPRRKLKLALASTTSPEPSTSVVETRIAFRRRLAKFRQLQASYQPEVTALVAQLSSSTPTSPDTDAIQDAPLLLPSSLPPELLRKCSKRLVSMETALRIGQCRDSLSLLRTKLTAQARLLKYKYVNVRHQVPNTRSRSLLNRVNVKIEACAVKYRHAFQMLRVLDSSDHPEWRSEFLELRPQDVRSMGEGELPSAPTRERAEELQARTLLNGNVLPEGNRIISWIWRGALNSVDRDGQKDFGEGSSYPI